jgi:hypothetical protein
MKHFSSKVAILVVLALVFSMLPITNLFLISDAAEPTPVFTDSFENKINTDSSLSSSIYKLTIQSSNKVSFVTGKVGSGVHLDALSSYIGYSAKYINPEEGTIRFYFKPDSNLYDFYNTRQAEWKDYGSYKSPFSGIMLDEVGFLGAFSGAFGSYINFPGDKNNKNISIGFQTWSGSTWSQATFTTKDNFVLSSDKFYDFAFTWSKSEGTIKIYIDGELKASGSYNTPLSSKELFFIGHIPFQNYYPYGPHSLIGTYDELRIYNTALKDFGTSTPQNPTPQETPTGTTIIKLVVGKSAFTVNGKSKTLDSPPVIKNGRTLLPIRPVIESLGGTVAWDSATRKVTIKLGSTTIELWIDNKNAKVNGVTKTLDVAPQIINGRTMVPVRFVSENLGAKVDWDDKTKTITITYSGGTVAGAVEKVFTSSGGELTLSDGTKLIVPAGAFSSDTKVTVASVPSAFGKDSKGIDISGLQNLKGEITLTFSTEKGLSKEEVSVFGYDSSKDTTFDITNSYDSSTGIVTVKISPSALTLGASINRLLSLFSTQNSQGIIDRLSVVFEKTESYIPKKSEYLIQMPYYGQVGEACWVACTNMLIHGYMGAQAGEPVSKTLNYIKVDEDNFGIGVSGFTNTLPNYISIQTNGKKVTWRGFSFSQHMQWEILRQLDAGHPIIMRYLASKHPHTVLIIGYKNKGADIDLIIHDPQNVVPDSENGTMYTVEPWSWVERHISLYRKACQLLWIDESLSSAKTLQTIECSGGDEAGGNPYGSISFNTVNVRNNREVLLATLKFRPSVASGYTWENAGKVVEVISGQASKLKMQLPVWNASFEDKKLSVTVQINTGATKLYSNDKSISVGTASYNSEAKKTYTIDIPLEEVRNVSLGDAKGIQNITLYVNLNEGSTEKDKFFIDAKLSLIPIVESIDPTSGKVGDTITISGFSFGKNKSTKSRVTINDKDVDIVSWSDKEIKVKLTQDVGNGPVVVYTGEKYEYVSNKDVTFGMASPCDKSYEVYCTEVPLWNSMDCKWDSSKQLIRLCVTLKSGKVSGTGSTCYGNSQEVSGTYDASGNITFTFTWKGSYGADDTRGFIVTGTFTGKLAKGCTFSGTAKGTARAYDKSPMYCKPYDLKQDFSSPMYDKNYKP